ncbi:MAG: hypothetical protein AB8F94_29805 [Saprospiraceae bacterium]
MKLRYFLSSNFLLTILFLTNINGQCTLPSGSYAWGNTELIAHITDNCGGAVTELIIPTDAIITIQNNDPWDLITYGAMIFRIQGMGSLGFNGSDALSLAGGSQLIIDNTSNTSALSESGNGTNIRINIGATTYTGNQFGAIIAAGGANESGILPIELIKFYSYTTDRNEVELIWETASEINNMHFEIEHSLNGIDFERIGIVEGKGTTNINQVYNYVHLKPSSGNNYYRLKQVDYDLMFEYFKVISQLVKGEKGFQVKVNSLDLLSVEINQPAQILVLDMTGRIVFENKITEGVSNFRFENLAQGNYVVHVFNSIVSDTVRVSR